MTLLPALPIIIPLAGAVLCMLFRRNLAVQRGLSLSVSTLLLFVAIRLMAYTRDGTIGDRHAIQRDAGAGGIAGRGRFGLCLF